MSAPGVPSPSSGRVVPDDDNVPVGAIPDARWVPLGPVPKLTAIAFRPYACAWIVEGSFAGSVPLIWQVDTRGINVADNSDC